MQAQDPRTPWMDDAEELGHVLKARKGDRRAFLALLRHYHRPAYRLAFALTRDVQAAAAVTHAAVLKAKAGVRYMAEGGRFFPWVAGIVRNLARGRRSPFQAPPPGSADSGEVDLAARLLEAMDNLDPDPQAAVALRIVELLPHSLIEAVLRVTPGSAASLLAGARVRLTPQAPAAAPQRARHLTPDQLSEHLEGESFDLVRQHLESCGICRAQCLRMASANDMLTALLTHDPDDRFFAALQGFLEAQFDAHDPADSIPPELERRFATESARLEAERWAAVRRAIPRAPVILASAVRPLGIAGPDATVQAKEVPSTPKRGRARTEEAAARPGAESKPAGPAGAVRALPAMAPPAASRRMGFSPGRGGWSGWIGAGVAALVLLMAGFYFTPRGHRAPAVDSHAASGPARTVSAPVLPIARARASGKVVDMPEPVATGSTAESSTAGKAKGAPETRDAAPVPVTKAPPAPVATAAVVPATKPPAAAAATPPKASMAPAPAPHRAAALERGILCGQVRDESGAPIVRARVLLADLQVGALTDGHGRFCVSVPIGSRTVSVIALGFTTQRRVVMVGRKTPEVSITLRSTAAQEPSGTEER